MDSFYTTPQFNVNPFKQNRADWTGLEDAGTSYAKIMAKAKEDERKRKLQEAYGLKQDMGETEEQYNARIMQENPRKIDETEEQYNARMQNNNAIQETVESPIVYNDISADFAQTPSYLQPTNPTKDNKLFKKTPETYDAVTGQQSGESSIDYIKRLNKMAKEKPKPEQVITTKDKLLDLTNKANELSANKGESQADYEARLATVKEKNPQRKGETAGSYLRKLASQVMPLDPDKGKELLSLAIQQDNQERLATKTQADIDKDQNKQINISLLTAEFDRALEDYYKNPNSDKAKKNLDLLDAKMKQYGINIDNPAITKVREEMARATLGLKGETLDVAKKNQDIQQEQFNKRLTLEQKKEQSDNYYKQKDLELKQIALELKNNPPVKLTPELAGQLGSMEESEPIIDELGSIVANDYAMYKAAEAITNSDQGLLASLGRDIANVTSEPDTQRWANAVSNVSKMLGRLLSGAAISPTEEVAFKNNIPRHGDSQEILKQKKAFRTRFYKDLRTRGTGSQQQQQQQQAPIYDANKAEGNDW